MADKWGWKLPEMRVFEVRPEADRVKRKKWVVRHGSCTLCRRKEEGMHALKVKWNHGAISSLSEMKQLRFLNIALRAKKVVRNKNLKKSRQEARRGKMSFFAYFKEEFQVIQERDPAIHSPMEVLLYPSFRVMLKYRRAHKLYLKGHYFLARWISQRAARKTGIEIHPGATIGKGLFIDHGAGVIIGETTVIGDNVTLYQGVTLGGNGKETGKRHPTLKDNVMVSAGAKIIGSFTIGENSKIGAGSVVIEEVPPNCTVVGVPGHIVKQNDVRIPRNSMDHIHLPDPIFEDIKVLQQENTELTNRVLELEGELRQMRKKERT